METNTLVTDSYLLKLLLVVFGFGLQAFVCDFSRQNICSVVLIGLVGQTNVFPIGSKDFFLLFLLEQGMC